MRIRDALLVCAVIASGAYIYGALNLLQSVPLINAFEQYSWWQILLAPLAAGFILLGFETVWEWFLQKFIPANWLDDDQPSIGKSALRIACIVLIIVTIIALFTLFSSKQQFIMNIIIDDLSHPKVHALLHEHLAAMQANSPADCMFALDLAALKQPSITFWTAWDNDEILGCGALSELSAGHGEIKSMRTAAQHIRRGVADALLQTIIAEAQRRAYRQLSLETGSSAAFSPALALYHKHGFTVGDAFAAYTPNDFSVFMHRSLTPR